MRILYTPEELDRRIRWWWIFALIGAVSIAIRRLWIPNLPPATELGCGLLGATLWGISKGQSSEQIRNMVAVLGLTGGFMFLLILVVRFIGLRNGGPGQWAVAIDFAIGARALVIQLVVVASAYICHGGLNNDDDEWPESRYLIGDASLVTEAD